MKTSELLLLAGAGYLAYKLIPQEAVEEIASGGGISIDLGGLGEALAGISGGESGVAGALSGLSNAVGSITSYLGGGGLVNTIKETVGTMGIPNVDDIKGIVDEALTGVIPKTGAFLTLKDLEDWFNSTKEKAGGPIDDIIPKIPGVPTITGIPFSKYTANAVTGLDFLFGGMGEMAYQKWSGGGGFGKWLTEQFTPESAKPSDYALQVLTEAAFDDLGINEVSTPEDLYKALKNKPQYQTIPYPESVEQEYEVAYPPTKEEAEVRKQLSSGGKTPPVVPPARTPSGGYRPPTPEEAARNAAKQAAKEKAEADARAKNTAYGDIHGRHLI